MTIDNAAPASDPRSLIDRVIRAAAWLGIAETALAVFWFRDVPVPLGIFLGALLAVLSFILLANILMKWIVGAAKNPVKILLLIFGKFALLAVVFWLSFRVLKTDLYAFLVGYANLPLAITISGLRR